MEQQGKEKSNQARRQLLFPHGVPSMVSLEITRPMKLICGWVVSSIVGAPRMPVVRRWWWMTSRMCNDVTARVIHHRRTTGLLLYYCSPVRLGTHLFSCFL